MPFVLFLTLYLFTCRLLFFLFFCIILFTFLFIFFAIILLFCTLLLIYQYNLTGIKTYFSSFSVFSQLSSDVLMNSLSNTQIMTLYLTLFLEVILVYISLLSSFSIHLDRKRSLLLFVADASFITTALMCLLKGLEIVFAQDKNKPCDHSWCQALWCENKCIGWHSSGVWVFVCVCVCASN